MLCSAPRSVASLFLWIAGRNSGPFMAGVCSKEKILPHELGGMDDHAHLLIQLPPTWSLSDAIQEIKTSSSRWMGRVLPGNAALPPSA